jgi:SpoVK/Ycf46/Vps4 family AAA+-type ATPase
MYTEIVKIIEGGLVGDKEKVFNYSNVLADNLERDGDHAFSKKIKSLLSTKQTKMASLDSFTTKPVDIESRMDIVEISYPQIDQSQVILSKYIEREIDDFIACYRKRDDFLKAGLDISNTLLLHGPPGCGKTTVAHLISNITGLPLVTAQLDGLISSLLGSTAKNIRRVFDYAVTRECILFLDEFDVIAKLRDDTHELGELKRVVNSLIQNIDNFNNNSLLIAATNHENLLDPAIWRRFSKVIILEKPLETEIDRLLEVLLNNINNNIIGNEKKTKQIIDALVGFSHSEIKTIITNAIKKNIVNDQITINHYDVLKEIYFHKNHSISDENDFIKYLVQKGTTKKEIKEVFGFPRRKVQKVSKSEGE